MRWMVAIACLSILAGAQTQSDADLPVIVHRRVPESYCELVEQATLHLADSGITLQMANPKEDLLRAAVSTPFGFLEYDPNELKNDDRENTFYAARNAGFTLQTGQPAATKQLPSLQLAKDMPAAPCGSVEAARQVLASQPLPEWSRNPSAQKTPPHTIKQTSPQYSQRARREGIQGHVVVTLLLKADGTPTYIFVSRSLDLDLDKNAIDAVRNWQFNPAEIDGHPIPAWINVDVDFHLYAR